MGKIMCGCFLTVILLFIGIAHSGNLTPEEIEAWARSQHISAEMEGNPRLSLDIECVNGAYLYITSNEIVEGKIVVPRYELEISLVEGDVISIEGIYIVENGRKLRLSLEGKYVADSTFKMRGSFDHSSNYGRCFGDAKVTNFKEL